MTTTTAWRLVPAQPGQDWTDAFAARGPRIGSFVSTIYAVLDTAPAPSFDLLRALREIRSSLAFLPAADAAITGLDRILQAVAPQDALQNDTGDFDALSELRAPVAGEAVNLREAREYLGQWGCLANPNVRALLENAERAAPQASEAVRDAGIAASEDVAPWTDFAGNPIKHGDRIRHPKGLEGVVVRLPGYADAHDAWCVAYQDRTVSRLSLQIGDRGQAVVQGALSAQPGAQKNGGSDA